MTERVAGTVATASEVKRALPAIGALVALAGAAVWFLASTTAFGSGPVEIAGVLVILGLVAELLPFEGLPRNAAGSIGFVPYLAAAVVSPDVSVAFFLAAAQIAVQVWHRRPWVKALFNTAQMILAVSIGIVVFRVTAPLGNPSLAGGFWESLRHLALPGVASFAAMTVANTAAVTGVVSLTAGRPFWATLIASLKLMPFLAVLQTLLAIYLAWISVNLGWTGTAGMVLPLVVVRQLTKTTIQLTRVTEELLDLMVAAIEARDPYTSGHSKRVAAASVKIAKALKLRQEQVERVQVAALLHDVGKIHEEFARILAKEGRLTPEEWVIMKRHPVRSADLVGLVSSLRDVVPSVRHHHENWDGTGYPDGRRGDEIPLASRIIMFADTLDAITTDRPYRKALDPDEARKEFVKFRGKQFDPYICDVVVADEVWEDLYHSALTSRQARVIPSAVA